MKIRSQFFINSEKVIQWQWFLKHSLCVHDSNKRTPRLIQIKMTGCCYGVCMRTKTCYIFSTVLKRCLRELKDKWLQRNQKNPITQEKQQCSFTES